MKEMGMVSVKCNTFAFINTTKTYKDCVCMYKYTVLTCTKQQHAQNICNDTFIYKNVQPIFQIFKP